MGVLLYVGFVSCTVLPIQAVAGLVRLLSYPCLHAGNFFAQFHADLETRPLARRPVLTNWTIVLTRRSATTPGDTHTRFFLLLLSSFFLSLYVVPRVPVPSSFSVRFVLSSCCFPFVSCIAFFAFLFSSLRSLGGGFCYSVISSRRYPPPALLANLKYAYSPCVLSCIVDVDLFNFILLFLPSLFRFRFGRRLFHPVFFLRVLVCCLLGFGFCCDSFSI